MLKSLHAYIDSLIERLINCRVDDCLASSVTQITREQLDTIDLDRVVAKAVQHIDWSEHIDWYQLASHMEIDYTDLCRYIEIDSSELADELKDKIQLSILIQ
ncbi:MAG: hypothetical protein R3C09_27550 [Pirellulaceae bacterium]